MLTFSHLNAETFQNRKKSNGRRGPRVREPVACNHCRKSKVRCDRKSPCKPCKDRGIDTQCIYVPSKAPTIPQSTTLVSLPGSTELDSVKLQQQPTPHSSDVEILDSRSAPSPNQTARNATGAFRGLNLKTRLIGGTHWMAACNDLPVIKALLEKSADFQSTWKTFAELKSLLRVANSVPASINGAGNQLIDLLPDRLTCEMWIGRYYETYGRVYQVIEKKHLVAELEQLRVASSETTEVQILRVLLVIAISMQTEDSDRLRGRLLLQEAENRINKPNRFQKPCVGVVQTLLLLIILKTIATSETDKPSSIMSSMGQATQFILSMGLHRDPGLFPSVTPYYAEVRKRLWACFFRLHLDWCVSSGSQFSIRLEDVDCPLPTAAVDLETLESSTLSRSNTSPNTSEEETDQAFSIAAMKLAVLRAPMHQQLCSTNPQISNELRSRMRASFHKILRELPSRLQAGSPSSSSIEKLQQSLLSVHVHSFMIIITQHLVPGDSVGDSQQGDLYELWDHSVAILYHIQELLHADSRLSKMAYHILWTDLTRAALTACLVVGRLQAINLKTTVSNSPPPTLVMFQQLLLKSLDSASNILTEKFYLGPVAAKTRLIFAVATKVTSTLISDFGSSQQDSRILQAGITAAEKVVVDMHNTSMKLRHKDSMPTLLDSNPACMPASLDISESTSSESNFIDPTQTFDFLAQMSFLNTSELFQGMEPLDFDMQPSMDSPYSMAAFEIT